MNIPQDNLTGTNTEGASPNLPLKCLTASSIIGDQVLNKQGEELGQVKDIMLNINTGSIEYYIIEFGGFLGIGEKFFAIPFSLLTVDAVKRVFIFDQQKDVLEQARGSTKITGRKPTSTSTTRISTGILCDQVASTSCTCNHLKQ